MLCSAHAGILLVYWLIYADKMFNLFCNAIIIFFATCVQNIYNIQSSIDALPSAAASAPMPSAHVQTTDLNTTSPKHKTTTTTTATSATMALTRAIGLGLEQQHGQQTRRSRHHRKETQTQQDLTGRRCVCLYTYSCRRLSLREDHTHQ